MSETDSNLQPPKLKIYGPATASLVLGIFVLVMLVLAPPSVTSAVVGFSMLVIAGLVLGIVALVKIKKSRGRLTGWRSAIFGIVINGFLVFLIVFGTWSNYKRQEFYRRSFCGANLRRLGMAILLYSTENDKHPTADKWCDLLLQPVRYVEGPERFVCKFAGEGRCHYAINPHATPNSPPDIVLLFETKGGWNQSGGLELLTTENHKGKGCNVLFNDYRVEFIKTEQLGELKWKVEENKNNGKSVSK